MFKDQTMAFTRMGAALLFLLSSISSPISAQPDSVIEVIKFSAEKAGGGLPTHWEPLHFKNIETHTTYSLIDESSTVALKAVANASASGLTRKITIDPKEYPIIQWRWKVMNVLEKGDVSKKEGDDYPARIYVTFEYEASQLGFFDRIKFGAIKLLYGQSPPLRAINYIWASKAPKGLIVPNPYTDRAMMFVVESGKEKLNQWVSEERNVYEDYQKAFQEEPPRISGVAIMTDTDNTGESAVSYYGDITFKKARGG